MGRVEWVKGTGVRGDTEKTTRNGRKEGEAMKGNQERNYFYLKYTVTKQ